MSDERPGTGFSHLDRATATIRIAVDDPGLVAAAIKPDDTPEIHTRVDGGRVVTTVERETIGGLRTTVDDIVVNLTVATKTAQLSDQQTEHDNHE